MGEITDYYYNRALDEEIRYYDTIDNLESRYNDREKIWETRGGEYMSLQEMNNKHLINSINYLKRQENPNELTFEYIRLLEVELKSRDLK